MGIDVTARQGSSESPPDAAPPGSMLSQLRANAEAQRKHKTHDVPIGGSFGDRLVGRYGLLPVSDLERFSELQGRVTNVALAIDLLAATCETLLWVDDGNETDLNVGYDAGLWELLGWPLPPGIESAEQLTQREVITAVFGDNALALASHVEVITEWFQEAGGDPVGEPSAPTP